MSLHFESSNVEPPKPSMLSAPNEFPEPGLDATNLQRDRFELLSAYLDGEVSADERRQVEAWLAEDPTMQQLYKRLLKLHQGFQALPTPAPSQPVDLAIAQVLKKVDRRPRLTVLWGSGAAIAAAGLVAIVSSLSNPGNNPQFATQPAGQDSVAIAPANNQPSTANPTGAAIQAPEPTGLLVSLDEPVMLIAKTEISTDLPTDSPTRNADNRN
ncbi:MAG: zf-HC2 domain-containing protein [Synechococcales bacterium]|nr:zf-HC2 domain-containing protein [Synechococcales bacterium]